MNIRNLKENEFIVLYESFFEYSGNFGEGNWDDNFKIFQSAKLAHDFVKESKENHNYRNVIGPLKYIGAR